jgi:S-DNA-T family DNA segregation ATPase FtsK/SpoIIIE
VCITVYEFQPAPGVKVSQIVNLQDDLALALKAESVRIERLPGRSTLGVEVPNKDRGVIRLGYLLDQVSFRRAPSVLTMALGTTIHGEPFFADLATMPHLLVAGATGAGKSIGLQGMITSIVYKARREQVQFIFIDPKRIELGVYKDIPHLKTEVVVEPKKAANALRWAVAEMERRYRLLAEVHVRSLDFYNQAISDPKVRERLAVSDGIWRRCPTT